MKRMRDVSPDVTALLLRWRQGDQDAMDELMPLVCEELRRMARHYMAGERATHTLQPTALVNEAYLRLVNVRQVGWKDRAHFFAMSARVMRRVLVDFARAHRYQKRGGGVSFVTFDEALAVSDESAAGVVALDCALEALAQIDERKSRVVELRFFAGLTIEETAAALDVSPDTVMRDWRLAKAWLSRELLKDSARRDSTIDES
jgi:RNA polymerase sigma-70 factor (ECF subfamily)